MNDTIRRPAIPADVVLPPQWEATLEGDGHIRIAGFRTQIKQGRRRILPDEYVVVSERLRNFAIGIYPPSTSSKTDYSGRGWRTKLYTDAVQALKSAINPVTADEMEDLRYSRSGPR